MKKMKRLIVSIIVCSFLVGGCIGSFSAFNKLRTWNQKATDEKWVNEVIFLGLLIIPVYSIASLADMIVFNSIEFWTGENPMDKVTISKKGETKAVQKFHVSREGKEMQIRYYEKEELKHVFTMHQTTGSSTITGHVDRLDGKRENFTVMAVEQGIRVIRTDSAGSITNKLYTGIALDQARLRINRYMSQGPLANAVQ